MVGKVFPKVRRKANRISTQREDDEIVSGMGDQCSTDFVFRIVYNYTRSFMQSKFSIIVGAREVINRNNSLYIIN